MLCQAWIASVLLSLAALASACCRRLPHTHTTRVREPVPIALQDRFSTHRCWPAARAPSIMSMSPEPEEESAPASCTAAARASRHGWSREAARAHGTLVTTTRASARSAKNLFDRDAMAHNLNAVDGCRSYLTLFGAVGAGVVGASTCVEINQCVGCTDNSSLSHFSAMTRPIWLGRAARNRHRHAIEQASRR